MLFRSTNSTTSKATVVAADGMAINADGELEVTLAGATGIVTLEATDGTDAFGSVTFEVLADAALTSITGVKDLTTKVSEAVGTTIGKENLIIKDQYGRDYTLIGSEGALVYFKSGASTALTLNDGTAKTGVAIDDGAAVIDATTGKTTATGTATAGTSTLVIALVTNTAAPATAVAGGTFEVAITNETNIVGYAIKEVPTLFGDATHTTATLAGDYAQVLEVVGLDAGGNEVAINQSLITALTSSNTSVIGVESASRKVFAKKEGTAIVSVWMGATKVAETTVTASEAAPQGQTVEFENDTNTVVSGTPLDLAAELTVEDQYGVELTSPEALGTWTSSNVAAATVDGAGSVTWVAAGETTISFVLSNGNAAGTVVVTAS